MRSALVINSLRPGYGRAAVILCAQFFEPQHFRNSSSAWLGDNEFNEANSRFNFVNDPFQHQVIGWDRRRPARNEREARKVCYSPNKSQRSGRLLTLAKVRARVRIIRSRSRSLRAGRRAPSQSLDAVCDPVPDKHLTLGELAIHPQAAHAAVRKNIKPEVRNDAGIQQLAFKKMSGVGL